MRNNKIFLSICLLVVTSISFAQVQKVAKLQIGNTTSAPEASAVLDVTSTTQGFLPPRMTSSQLLLIPAPSEGLIVYCKDCSIKGLYIFNGSAWSQLTGGASIYQSSNGSAVVSAYSCSTETSGTLTAGTLVSGVSQTITANVTEVGTYNISTTANGVTFAGAGTFASTGDQDIVLTATGTPITDGSSVFTLNTTPYCNFSRSAVFDLSTNGTAVVSAYSCSTASAGILTAGTAVSGVTQTITATVTTVGSYNISTIANGVTFSGTGTFASAGDQDIVLTATGTPIAAESSLFTLNTTPNCDFSRTSVFDLSTNGTAVVSAYSCSTASAGTLTAGTVASGVTQTITATVITVGSYNISTTANGVTFYRSGTFTATGDQAVDLQTSTIPTTAGYASFTLNTTPSYTFTRSVRVAATVSSVHIGGGVQKEYLSHNLGADTSLDPNVPVVGLQGAYIAWGKRGPNTTGNALVDWQTAPNDGANGFAAAPTAGNSNSSTISNWVTSPITNMYTWLDASGTKTALDPCPAGFRIPSRSDWEKLKDNNTYSKTGTFTSGATEYGSAIHYGPNASTKSITLPAVGRINLSKIIAGRGQSGFYWSSTQNGADGYAFYIDGTAGTIGTATSLLSGTPIRCISEE